MEYSIKAADRFLKSFNKIIPKNKQADIKRRILKLKHNPYTGKPLGFMFLRELKLDKFRIYYIINEEKVMIVFVDVGDKKGQRQTIAEIKNSIKNLNDGGLLWS